MEEPKDTTEETTEGTEEPGDIPEKPKDVSSILAFGVFGGLFVLMMVAVLLISLWDDIAPGSSKKVEPTSTPTQVVEATATPTATVEAVTLSFDAPGTVEERERFDVLVTITEVADFDTAQYQITYDAEVLKVIDVSSGEIGSVDILTEDWEFVPSGEQGTVQISNKAGGDSWASGSGYLAEVQFKVVGNSEDTGDIDFVSGSIELLDKDGEEIPATGSGASVAVQ
jgi:hypothetical protein